MFEDELHDESFGQDFATMDAAVAELRRLAAAPRRRRPFNIEA